MAHAFELTARDREILGMLTRDVRVATVAQIGAHWFAASAAPARNAGRRLDVLVNAGLIRRLHMMTRPAPEPDSPLRTWHGGEPAPDFSAIATRLAARWRAGLKRTPLAIATERAGVLFGGSGGRIPRLSEVSHDIALTAVYFRRFVHGVSPTAVWYSEARLAKLGFGDRRRLPDAMIEDRGIRTVIELGGAYSAVKLRAFHEFCSEEGLPYELW